MSEASEFSNRAKVRRRERMRTGKALSCAVLGSAIALLLCVFHLQVAQGQPATVAVEGPFGKAEVDVTHPALSKLYLRGPGGGLSAQSLLADRPVVAYGYRGPIPTRTWAYQGYSYVVGHEDARFESRHAAPENVDVRQEFGRTVLHMAGVKLSNAKTGAVAASEDWTLSAPGNGSQLVWQITRHWKQDFVSIMSGSPALFVAFDARNTKNATTSTLWHDPFRIAGRWSDLYAVNWCQPNMVSENRVQTILDRDAWAIYKLWTNWHAPVDLRLEVKDGHLYRRGSFAYLGEAGAVTTVGATTSHRTGDVEQITLKIGAVDKATTGYQLAITLPDKATERSLKEFYSSVLNGGTVNDQKNFDFGNESDGWYYAGSNWMYGVAMNAGVPAPGAISSRPYDVASAMREHLAHVMSTVDDQGRTHFGYNETGQCMDDNLDTIFGLRMYLLHSGDVAFVQQHLPVVEKMLDFYVKRRNKRGLFELDEESSHWYYDCILMSGTNGYHNAFFYKALCDVAEMERAAGRADKAAEYQKLASSVKDCFNAAMWRENAPGGARYVDWIDAKGKDVAYFCDICQWPPVAFGIASPEQARKIVATADARIKQIEKQYGYLGYAGLSALWPVPIELNKRKDPFGTYMNGGCLLSQTYWEIMARSIAGDREGAARRLKLFARRALETSWAGNNAGDIQGGWDPGCESGEPYLGDMVAATAATLHGILGVTPSWDGLNVTPRLPVDWPRAEADVLYKGRRHRIIIENGKTRIQALEQVIKPSLLWVMDFNLRTAPAGKAVVTNVDFLGPYGGAIALAAIRGVQSAKAGAAPSYAASGSYQSPTYDWGVSAKLSELTVAAELNGGRATSTIELSDDGFRTILSSVQIPIKDGVNAYPLDSQSTAAKAVRLRFDLSRGQDAAQTPILDGFRLSANP